MNNQNIITICLVLGFFLIVGIISATLIKIQKIIDKIKEKKKEKKKPEGLWLKSKLLRISAILKEKKQ